MLYIIHLLIIYTFRTALSCSELVCIYIYKAEYFWKLYLQFKPLFKLQTIFHLFCGVKVTFSSLFFLQPSFQTHFSVCKRCIRKMDHHCPWVNNCVGENNQKYFVLFTVSTKKSLILHTSKNTTNTVVLATGCKHFTSVQK